MRPPVKHSVLSMMRKFEGIQEIPGQEDNLIINAVLQATMGRRWSIHDEIPWCGAMMYVVAYLLGLKTPPSPARARDWLKVGAIVPIDKAQPGFDIVIIKRGKGPQPGPDVFDAPGHVTALVKIIDADTFIGLGGNQKDGVRESVFKTADILGIRRL